MVQKNTQILKEVLGPPKEISPVWEKHKREVEEFFEMKICILFCFVNKESRVA
jgi:hypothetical protein